jgi:hypothetical protein
VDVIMVASVLGGRREVGAPLFWELGVRRCGTLTSRQNINYHQR